MKKEEITEIIEYMPIIMAVKDNDGVEHCLKNDSKVVFVLFGDICSISDIVKKLKTAGKVVFVHMDMISGLGNKEISVDFLKNQSDLDGIISTRPSQIKRGKELGLFTILRFFVLDSLALESLKKQTALLKPDMIEILPGIIPKIIKKISDFAGVPIICGGLISDKEDVISALHAGAVAISSSKYDVWEL